METLTEYFRRGVGELNLLVNPPPRHVRSNKTRQLGEEDHIDFQEAASKRQPPPNIEQLREHFKAKNPHRWRRMNSDKRWAEKQLRKLGMNPDDWRWLL